MKKMCRKCKEIKDTETGFHKNPQSKDGRHPYCKKCRSKDRSDYYLKKYVLSKPVSKIRKVIVWIGLSLLLLNCEFTIEEVINVKSKYDYSFNNDVEIDSIEEALFFVYHHMSYKSDHDYGVVDFWQLPEESYDLKVGDCEDYVILFMYFLFEKLNISPYMVIAQDKGTLGCHAFGFYDGVYYNVNGGTETDSISDNFRVLYHISYGEVMWMTFYYRHNVGKYNNN